MDTIKWEDFEKVKLCVGTVKTVEDFPKARKPAWILHIDFGDKLGIKKSSAQITDLYAKDDLVGKQVVAVINFPAKQIGPLMSECLTTGFTRDDGAIVLVSPDHPVPNGSMLM